MLDLKKIEEFDNYIITPSGIVYNLKTKKHISPFIDKAHGVMKVALFKNGKQYKRLVHRLVALTYLTGKPSTVVIHIDGNKLNNDYSNLIWGKRVGPKKY